MNVEAARKLTNDAIVRKISSASSSIGTAAREGKTYVCVETSSKQMADAIKLHFKELGYNVGGSDDYLEISW